MSRIGVRAGVIAAAAVLLTARSAEGEAPATLALQGYLEDVEGTAIDDPAVSMRIALYAGDEAPIYEETQSIRVELGYFTAYVGAVTPIDPAIFRDQQPISVGVRVRDDPEEMRFPLALAAYAAFANHCGDATELAGHVPDEFARAAHGHAFGDLTGVPEGLADGDDGIEYRAGTGVQIIGNELALDSAQVQAWSREACFDSESEVRSVLDDDYLSASMPCLQGQVVGWTGSRWSCLFQSDTTYSAVTGGGLQLTGTGFSIASGGVQTSHIAESAVSSSKIAAGGVRMRELSLPAGSAARSPTALPDGGSIDQMMATPQLDAATNTGGICLVSFTGVIYNQGAGPQVGEYAYLVPAFQIGDQPATHFGSGASYYPAFQGYASSTKASATIGVPAGVNVTFGCRHGTTPGWGAGDTVSCYVDFLCL